MTLMLGSLLDHPLLSLTVFKTAIPSAAAGTAGVAAAAAQVQLLLAAAIDVQLLAQKHVVHIINGRQDELSRRQLLPLVAAHHIAYCPGCASAALTAAA